MKGNLKFPGNPWPKGHDLASLELRIRLFDAPLSACLELSLKSEEYYAREGYDAACKRSDDEEDLDLDSWEAVAVWSNYHACSIESEGWHEDLLLGTHFSKVSRSILSQITKSIDVGRAADDFDEQAFRCYILGHDAVADHELHIRAGLDDTYDISWKGRVALAYVGDYDFDHSFLCKAVGVRFGGYVCTLSDELKKSASLTEREVAMRGLAELLVEDALALKFIAGEHPYGDRLVRD